MATLEEISQGSPLVFAALIHLRRELAKVGEIKLTPLDFEAWQNSTDDGVHFSYEEKSGDIVLTHVSGKSDA